MEKSKKYETNLKAFMKMNWKEIQKFKKEDLNKWAKKLELNVETGLNKKQLINVLEKVYKEHEEKIELNVKIEEKDLVDEKKLKKYKEFKKIKKHQLALKELISLYKKKNILTALMVTKVMSELKIKTTINNIGFLTAMAIERNNNISIQYDDDKELEIKISEFMQDLNIYKYHNTKIDLGELSKYSRDLQKIHSNDPMKLFLLNFSQYPLLSREEELELTKRIKDLNHKNKLTLKEQKILKESKDKLIMSNGRLVVAQAKMYNKRGLELIDLIGEGFLGLNKAIEKFDYEAGFKFSTYATWWIRQAITRSIADQGRTIRVPVHMHETIQKLTKIERELTQKKGDKPTVKEIAKIAKMSVRDVEQAFKINKDPVSLDITVGEEQSTYKDFIQDETILSPEDDLEKNDLFKSLNDIVNHLPRTEREIIQLRYGIYKLDYDNVENRIKEYEKYHKKFCKNILASNQIFEMINQFIYFDSFEKKKMILRLEAEYNQIKKSKETIDVCSQKTKNKLLEIKQLEKEIQNNLKLINKLKIEIKKYRKKEFLKKRITVEKEINSLVKKNKNNKQVIKENKNKIKSLESITKKETKKCDKSSKVLILQSEKKAESLHKELEILHRIDKLTHGEIRRLTLEEVGKIHRKTRERIRQIESKAKRKMKAYAEEMKLDRYMQ